jgi:hypothetical protein
MLMQHSRSTVYCEVPSSRNTAATNSAFFLSRAGSVSEPFRIPNAAMAGVKYKVLLTRQKTQKNKRWAEGFLIEGEHGTFPYFICPLLESIIVDRGFNLAAFEITC